MELLLIPLMLTLAAANGANDVSKGIATLVNSGVTDVRRAVLWGSLWTVLGGLAAAFLSTKLLAVFSGKGLLLSGAVPGPAFLAAVGIGAAGWIIFATRTGLPVSTTHALVGGLCGAALLAAGAGGIDWTAMTRKILLSLAFGPVLALALLYTVSPAVSWISRRLKRYCLCYNGRGISLASGVASIRAVEDIRVGEGKDCAAAEPLLRIEMLDAAHWLSAGLTSFARGMNDTPKVLALGLGAAAALGLSQNSGFFLTAGAMGLGSLWAGTRVTRTLSEKITAMSPSEGLGANVVTALLVGFASRFGLPVSTTHVSSGAIIATGLRRGSGSVRWNTVGEMLLAWIVTVPAAAALSAGAYWVLA